MQMICLNIVRFEYNENYHLIERFLLVLLLNGCQEDNGLHIQVDMLAYSV